MATDNVPFQSIPDDNIHIRIEKLDTNDDEARQAMSILREAKMSRNTIYLSEFRQYEPIFRMTGRDEIGDERFNDLCTEWMTRFSNFDPVYIKDDDTNQVVLTIPPTFNRINPINVVKNGSDIATGFSRACDMPDEFDAKKHLWGNYFNQAMQLANPPEALEAGRKQAEQMTATLKKQGAIRDPNRRTSDSVISNNTEDASSHTERIHTNIEEADVEPL